jgi:hypothetical protein
MIYLFYRAINQLTYLNPLPTTKLEQGEMINYNFRNYSSDYIVNLFSSGSKNFVSLSIVTEGIVYYYELLNLLLTLLA